MYHDFGDDLVVGALEHEFYDFPYIGNVIIPIDSLLFFRGIETTKLGVGTRWSSEIIWDKIGNYWEEFGI